MIVNVRGTSGSGKSTLVRRVMELCDRVEPVYVEGRKRPIGYQLEKGDRLIFVVGHYETECGGCDTIATDAMETIHRIVREQSDAGLDVLFEGLLISAEARRLVELHQNGYPIKVVVLDLPLAYCLAGVQERRGRKSPGKELGPNTLKNLESKHKGALRCAERFEAAGMDVVKAGREEALKIVEEALRLC